MQYSFFHKDKRYSHKIFILILDHPSQIVSFLGTAKCIRNGFVTYRNKAANQKHQQKSRSQFSKIYIDDAAPELSPHYNERNNVLKTKNEKTP